KIPPFVDENDSQKTSSPASRDRKKIQHSDDGKPIFNKDEKFDVFNTAPNSERNPNFFSRKSGL
ncbi:hypothetical protein KJ885_06425, partial [Patescibacteria group bacterium]|nr:hypothetical protein [Patescibacteria group bacterium]